MRRTLAYDRVTVWRRIGQSGVSVGDSSYGSLLRSGKAEYWTLVAWSIISLKFLTLGLLNSFELDFRDTFLRSGGHLEGAITSSLIRPLSNSFFINRTVFEYRSPTTDKSLTLSMRSSTLRPPSSAGEFVSTCEILCGPRRLAAIENPKPSKSGRGSNVHIREPLIEPLISTSSLI